MTSGCSLAFALAIWLATPAATPPPKHDKPALDMQNVEVPVRRATPPAPRTELAPRLTIEQFVADRRGRLDRLIGQQMPLLRRMIAAATPDDPELPDFYFRLAELCAERSRYLEHRARALDEAIFQAREKAVR
jgi:hypothetical protein